MLGFVQLGRTCLAEPMQISTRTRISKGKQFGDMKMCMKFITYGR